MRKTQSPAIAPPQLGPIDAGLLSHDHHFDNLDHSGCGSSRLPTRRTPPSLAPSASAARIVPLHYEGWEHFTETRSDVEQASAAAGLAARLLWLSPGVATTLPLSG